MPKPNPKLCRQRLFVDGLFVARCTVPYDQPHSHDFKVARLVAEGKARWVRSSRPAPPPVKTRVENAVSKINKPANAIQAAFKQATMK